ncbi:hypothetical protein ACLB2K_066315 [Fragaria x ananassa]
MKHGLKLSDFYPWGLVQLVADCSSKLGERYSDTLGSKEVTALSFSCSAIEASAITLLFAPPQRKANTHFSTLIDLSNSRIIYPKPLRWQQSNTLKMLCICLDSVRDPVITLCGHLYCWPCIYKWIQFQTPSSESQEDQKQPQCPVCKTEVSESSLVPLYGRGQTTKPTKPSKGKAPHLGIVIPKRPLAPCGVDTPRTPSTSPYSIQRSHPYQSQINSPLGGSYTAASPMHSPGDTSTQVFNPMVGMFGEMVYSRVFGNSITNVYTHPNSYNLAGSTSPRRVFGARKATRAQVVVVIDGAASGEAVGVVFEPGSSPQALVACESSMLEGFGSCEASSSGIVAGGSTSD